MKTTDSGPTGIGRSGMRVKLIDTRVGLRNSSTRLTFRYGRSCLTHCPQLTLSAQVMAESQLATGYSGDCLPPGWFDKSPDKTYPQQIQEMLDTIEFATVCFADRFQKEDNFFYGWLDVLHQVQQHCRHGKLPLLLGSFAVSLVERAMVDAICRRYEVRFSDAVLDNLLGLQPAAVHRPLDGLYPRDWLPARPLSAVAIRHTVGLSDPLTSNDLCGGGVDDGYPETLEQYVQQTGVRYLKVKVANDLVTDLARLRTIAAVVEATRGQDYRVTLDGNEQYDSVSQCEALISAIQQDSQLATFWSNVLLLEQPLHRGVALQTDVATLGRHRPVIIDESDDGLDSFAKALHLGYRGVSSKNCKGPLKSLLNAGLVWQLNQHHGGGYLMSAEDLCNVGVVPLQSDLCLVATIGLDHVERNGHHYHPGLSYLPEAEQQAALAAHPDLYYRQGPVIRPWLRDGRLQIGSLQTVGFGFDALPDMESMQSPQQWTYASLQPTKEEA